MLQLLQHPELVRNVAFLGHLHHGKTTFMDLLVQQTHEKNWGLRKEQKYTDTRPDEQARGVSIKGNPMTLVLPNTHGKSFLLNLMDAPGHVNFSDEATAAIRLADGAVIFIDACEGVMMNTERMIKHALNERLPICIVLNKLDRLILELKLPPTEAYYKIRNTIDEVNELLASYSQEINGGTFRVSPELGNVAFASPLHGWSFTLHSFAKLYADTHNSPFPPSSFAQRLWGDVYFNAETRGFVKAPPQDKALRTFVQFILEPLYKLYSQVVGEDPEDLQVTLQELGIRLSAKQLALDSPALLKLVLSKFFGNSSGFVDMIVSNIPSPLQGARTKVEQIYTGPLNTPLAEAMFRCDSKGPLMIHITKLYPKPDYTSFDAFGRVMSGTARVGQRVKVLGENYTLEDEEDMTACEISAAWIYESRYRIDIETAPAGSWVLLEGIESSISKTATVIDNEFSSEFDPFIFKV